MWKLLKGFFDFLTEFMMCVSEELKEVEKGSEELHKEASEMAAKAKARRTALAKQLEEKKDD